jgi:hypothetical protein
MHSGIEKIGITQVAVLKTDGSHIGIYETAQVEIRVVERAVDKPCAVEVGGVSGRPVKPASNECCTGKHTVVKSTRPKQNGCTPGKIEKAQDEPGFVKNDVFKDGVGKTGSGEFSSGEVQLMKTQAGQIEVCVLRSVLKVFPQLYRVKTRVGYVCAAVPACLNSVFFTSVDGALLVFKHPLKNTGTAEKSQYASR